MSQNSGPGVPAAAVVELIKLGSATIEKATSIADGATRAKAAAASLVPETIDLLEEAGLISPQERAKAAETLNDHAATIATLGNFARRELQQKAANLGRGADPGLPRTGDSLSEADATWRREALAMTGN